jgi:hypothetical protein
MSELTREEARAELARLQAEAGRIDINSIKPGITAEKWQAAANEVLRILAEEKAGL